MFEHESAEYIEQDAAQHAHPQVEAEGGQQHARTVRLRRVAQLRQCVGDGAG